MRKQLSLSAVLRSALLGFDWPTNINAEIAKNCRGGRGEDTAYSSAAAITNSCDDVSYSTRSTLGLQQT
jgi:hypothetical protein